MKDARTRGGYIRKPATVGHQPKKKAMTMAEAKKIAKPLLAEVGLTLRDTNYADEKAMKRAWSRGANPPYPQGNRTGGGGRPAIGNNAQMWLSDVKRLIAIEKKEGIRLTPAKKKK
jgi:hypothetical protein